MLDILDEMRNPYGTVRIEKVFRPFTKSCAMKVTLHPGTRNENTAVLKLYDRRFSEKKRKYSKIPLWTPEREKAYRQYVLCGDAAKFVFEERAAKSDNNKLEWSTGDKEIYLHEKECGWYDAETQVYHALQDLQGKGIPKFFQKVIFDPEPSADAIATPFLEVPGILIEYIEGTCVKDFEKSIPQACWQDVCDQSVELAHKLGDYDVSNRACRLEHLIARKKTGELPESQGGIQYEVVMIDFGSARLRRPNESDYQWGKEKHWCDEAGDIGSDIKSLAKKHNVKIRWHKSRRWYGIWIWEDHRGLGYDT